MNFCVDSRFLVDQRMSNLIVRSCILQFNLMAHQSIISEESCLINIDNSRYRGAFFTSAYAPSTDTSPSHWFRSDLF